MSEHTAEGLTFVLPIHNQATTLEKVLSCWGGVLEGIHRPYEILLVDDGSTDMLGEALHGVAGRHGLLSRYPHMRLLQHSSRRGYGASIRTALEEAKHPLFFYTGCDHPYQPTDIRQLLHRIQESDPETGDKLQVVNGYRATTPMPKGRRIWGAIYRGFQRIAFGLQSQPLPGWLGAAEHRYQWKIRALFAVRLHDINSRFKLFRRAIFDRIPIQSDGDFVHAEILAKANFLGCLMDELPIAQHRGPIPVVADPPPLIARGVELRRVFRNPDFGKPQLKQEPTPTTEPQPAVGSTG